METNIEVSFNSKGDLLETIKKIESSFQAVGQRVEETKEQVEETKSAFERLSAAAINFDGLLRGIERVTHSFNGLIAPGVALNTSLTDLQAITGVTGEELRQIESYARETAKAFGVDAAGAVESYKLILGQLSPELAKTPEALKTMGEHVATLSKLMGGDAAAAAETLNTAMNQYGVDLSDPIRASEEMARMMHVMAAAGQEGSAELPQIKEALEQAGMAAKGAGVSFEEANAAIQVLDKAGKKGSEGGIALRNVLATLSQGRFLPKDVRKELSAAGVSVTDLADRGRSLKERLELLRPVMDDAALFSKLFGKENTNAAMALVGSADEVERYTNAIQDTSSASDQASVVMEGFAERQARIRQAFEDIKIEIFNNLGDFAIWGVTIGEAIVPIMGLIPLLTAVGNGAKYAWRGVSWLAGVIGRSSLWKGFLNFLSLARVKMIGFTASIWKGIVAGTAFIARTIWSGIQGIGYYILSLITGGTAQVTFSAMAGVAFSAFSTAVTTACTVVSTAIYSIPLVGWIALAIAAIAALGVYFWNTSAKFRAVLKGLWASFKTVFSGIWDMAKEVFTGLGELIISALSFDGDGINNALSKMSGAMSKFGADTANAFRQAYDEEMARSEAEEKAKGKKKEGQGQGSTQLDKSLIQIINGEGDAQGGKPQRPDKPSQGSKPTAPGTVSNGGTHLTNNGTPSSSGKASGGAGKIHNVTINIGKLVESLTIQTTNLSTDPSEVRSIIVETLLSAVNDANLAIQ